MIYLDRAESMIVTSASLKTNRLYFPENLRLRGKKINKVWYYGDDTTTANQAYLVGRRFANVSQRLVNLENIASDYLVLVNGEYEIVSKAPLAQLYYMTKIGQPLTVDDVIDYSKCYIERDGAKTDGDFCFVFGIQNADINTNNALYRYENTEVIANIGDQLCKHTEHLWYDSRTINRRFNFEDSEKFRGRLLKQLLINYDANVSYTPLTSAVDLATDDETKLAFPGQFSCASMLTPLNRNLIPKELSQKGLITLTDINGDEIFYRIPVEMLDPNFTTQGPAFGFNGLRLNWKRCYIDDYSCYKMQGNVSNVSAYYFGVILSDEVKA